MKTFLFKTTLFTMIFLILFSFSGGAPGVAQAAPKPTNTPKPTSTLKPTNTPKSTNTPKPTNTPKFTFTPTSTQTATQTATATPTATQTSTPTFTATVAPTNTPTSTPTDTPTATPTFTDTPTATPTDTPTATPTDTAVPTTLLAYWKLDEGSGNTAADDSGNGHTLQLTPIGLWTSNSAPTGFDNPNALDIIQACSSDFGCNNYHSVDSINLANQSFTVAMWVKRDVDSNNTDFFFSLGSSPSPYQTFQMGFRSSTIFTCGFWGDDLNISGFFRNTDWHHYVCSYDADTNTRKAYVDGLLMGSDHPAASFQGSGPVKVAAGISNRFVDDIRLYGNALSDAQVSALVPRSAPCEINADLLPMSGTRIPQLLQLEATDTNHCSVPVEYHWQCQSDTSLECPNFLASANAGPNGNNVPILNLEEFTTDEISLTICEVGNPSNCSSLTRVYQGVLVN